MIAPKPVLAALLGLSTFTACAQADESPVREPHQRPAANSDEGGFWDLADRAEAKVKRAAELNRSSELNAYVRQVTCKVSPTYCPELRLYVLDRPFFNAQVMPNGYAEVWSGLLLRARDESELAFVLGHEITHYSHNHALHRLQEAQSTGRALAVLRVGLAVATLGAAAGASSLSAANSIGYAGQSVIDITYLAGFASSYAFSRENETEADAFGFRQAADAGYRPEAAPDLWRGLTAEVQASDFEETRKSFAHGSIFNTHPVTSERIAALSDLAAQCKAVAATPEALHQARHEYRAKIRPFLSAWLHDDLRRRDYGQSLALLDRLSELGEDRGLLSYYRGEAYRLRRKDGDLVKARAAYIEVATAADAPVDVYRALGDADAAAGDAAGAKTAYMSYLEKTPAGGEDRWLVEDSLKSLTSAAPAAVSPPSPTIPAPGGGK